MDALIASLAPQALLFLLIATRVSAMVATAPILSTKAVPVRVRAGIVILVSYVALPGVAASGGTVPGDPFAFAMLAGREAIIGLAFGLVAQMLFAAVQTAGALIDVTAGFAIAQTIDPTMNTSVSILGRWYSLIATSAFLAVGGHQMLVAGVVRSFDLAPPLSNVDMGAVVLGVLARADDILLVSLQIGAPILAALVVTDVTLGIISRAVPQMNVFIVGLPLKIIVALAGTAILTPALVSFLNTLTGRMLHDLSDVMRAAGAG